MIERLPEFVSNHPLLCGGFLLVLVALIFSEFSRRMRRFKEVTPAGLTRLVNADDATIIDVGAAKDFESGHIPNAIHIQSSQLTGDAVRLDKYKDKPIALYCRTGQVSEKLCQQLSKSGFTDVYWLTGGLESWRSDELPVATGK